jgi:O-antigen/teichoic acid export membrane protein
VKSRAARRFELARLAITFGGLDRVVSSVVSLIRIPLLIWGLNLYQYGLYMAILGLAATANLLDFGLHLGVLNAVAAARGRDDEASIRQILATAFLIYTAIVAAATALILPAVYLLPLDTMLGIEASELPLARHVVMLAMASILLPMPFKVFAVGLDGFQKQYATSMFRSLSSVVQLALLAVGVTLFREQLLAVVILTVVGELLHWILFAFYAVRQQSELVLRLGAASRELASPLLKAGLLFFLTNLANLFKFALGSTIVSYGLGPATVATFSVPFALYMTGFSVANLVSASFWPAYGEAATRGEWAWVQRAFSLAARTSVGLGAFFAVLGALFADVLIDVWMPRSIAPSQNLLALLALWLIAQTAVHAGSNLLWGLDRVRIVTAMALIEGVSVIALGLVLVGRFGVEGMAAAMAASAFLGAALLLLYATPTGTAGQVRVPWGALLRILPCLIVAACFGLAFRHALADATSLLRLAIGAPATAAAFAATAWWVALLPDERQRLRSSTRRRLAPILGQEVS